MDVNPFSITNLLENSYQSQIHNDKGYNNYNDTICDTWHKVLTDNSTFVTDRTCCRTSGYNVVYTNHITNGTTIILKSNDKNLRQCNHCSCLKLQAGEQCIGYSVGPDMKAPSTPINGAIMI